MDNPHEDISVEREIDAHCDHFESLLKAGKPLDIDEFLRRVPPVVKPTLAVELLRLAVEYTGTIPSRSASVGRPPDTSSGEPKSADTCHVGLSNSAELQAKDSQIASAEAFNPVALTVIGDYELLEVIGSGGMGTVYRARQKSLDRLVALKILHPDRWKALEDGKRNQALQRFMREASAAGNHEHPNIITVYERGSWQGTQYLAMQLVKGKSLGELIHSAPLDNRRAAAYLEAVCRGLHAAHIAGIVHRDLKPSNILIESATDCPLLTDFGLAKVLDNDQELTLSGEVFGSPSYMSPEQVVNAATVSTATDIYGVGATLYHLLTGRPPYQASTVAGTLHQVLSTDPVPPRLLNPAVDRDVETICLKCLEKHPQHRYPDALAIARELQRYLAGQPIEARPLNRLEKTARWCNRHPAVAALLAALAITLATSFIVVTWLYSSERASAERANEALAINRRQLIQAYHGAARLSESPPSPMAQVWISSALALEKDDPAASYVDRVRWRRQFNSGPRLMQHVSYGSTINSVDLSPDGQRFLLCGRDGYARVWSSLGQTSNVREFCHNPSAEVSIARFSPDNKKFFTAGTDGCIRLWSTGSVEAIAKSMAHSAPVLSAAFSSDSRLIISGSADHTVCVWDLSTGERMFTPPKQDGPVIAVAFAPAGNRIAIATSRGTIASWSLASGEPLFSRSRRRSVVDRLQFDHSGENILCSTVSGRIELWKLNSADEPERALDIKSRILDEWLRKDAEEALVVAANGAIIRCPLSDRDAPIVQFRNDNGDARSARFSADGGKVAIASSNAIEIWSLNPAPMKVAEISAANAPDTLAFSADAKSLLSANGHEAQVWTIERNAEVVHRLGSPNVRAAWLLASRGQLLATFAEGRTEVLDLSTWRTVLNIDHKSHPIMPADHSFGSTLAIAEEQGEIRLIDVDTLRAEGKEFYDLAPLTAVAIDQVGKRLAVAGASGKVRIASSGKDGWTNKDLEAGQAVRWLLFTPDAERLLVVCGHQLFSVSLRSDQGLEEIARASAAIAQVHLAQDGTVFLVDAQGNVSQVTLRHGENPRTTTLAAVLRPYSMWTSRHGALCAFAEGGDDVRIVRPDDSFQTPRMAHPAKVVFADISASELLVATACQDGTVRVWDAQTGVLVCRVSELASPPIGTFFYDGDKRLLTVYADGRAVISNIEPDGREIAVIERESRLQTGYHLDQMGAPIPMTAAEFNTDWIQRDQGQ